MNSINLQNNNLTELTEENLISLCHLNDFKPGELTYLNLNHNNITNLDFIKENTPFINLKYLHISSNIYLKKITNVKYLNNLKLLNIINLKLDDEKETIELLKTMKKLEELHCYNTFKTYTYKQLEKELPYACGIY